ncbi:hypothetical protein M885DRAFT_626101 [Pelagophyceae sp. CCMP2097]|nr:hypothetical protein M885DRAFT_626101 [Pelagophyceae sp. CCMP2097]
MWWFERAVARETSEPAERPRDDDGIDEQGRPKHACGAAELSTWQEWDEELSAEVPVRVSDGEPEERAAAMTRSVTVEHLECAASLLRGGYGTANELARLRKLVDAAADVELGADPGEESGDRSPREEPRERASSSGRRAAASRAAAVAAAVADGVAALAARYWAAESRLRLGAGSELEDGVAEARALISRALTPRDTALFHDSFAARTAQLVAVVAGRVQLGEIDAGRVLRLLDDAGLAAEERGRDKEDASDDATDGARGSLVEVDAVVRRLEALRRRCDANCPQDMSGLLKGQGAAAADVELVAPADAEQVDGAPVDEVPDDGDGAAPGCVARPLSRAEMLQLKHVVHTIVTHAAPRAESQPQASSWWFSWGGLNEVGLEALGPRRFEAPPDTSGNRRWTRPADALAAYERLSAPRRGARLCAAPRIWCVSDLHVDASRNRHWLDLLPARPEDAIIVAGDVATSLKLVEAALRLLKTKFRHIFFVPGNHELWVRLDEPPRRDSVEKFFAVLKLCDDLGVHTSPAYVGDVLVVPLFSWYKRDAALGEAGALELFDAACDWPWRDCSSLDGRVADFMLALNEGALAWIEAEKKAGKAAEIVAFSHFVPHVTALFPGFTRFRHVMGCAELDSQLARLSPRMHVFGHSHVNVDEILRGTRFVQQALGHPSDGLGDVANFRPLLVWTAARDDAPRDGRAKAEPPTGHRRRPREAPLDRRAS